jgi:glucosamine-6-phosphate deaminase
MIMQVDNLQISLYENRQQMGEAAAQQVADRIRALLQEREQVNVIFAAAPSQNEFLAALSAQQLDWSRVNAFHMDEYVGLDKNAPQRFGNFLNDRLFAKVPFRTVHYLDGNVPAEDECRRYAALLKEYPTDITCMGIGENTHIAFNDPYIADYNDPLKVKQIELDLASRQQQVNDGCFKTLEQVPTHALTLTVPALLQAAYVYCMVPGSNKAPAVYHTLHEDISEVHPSTFLRRHPHAVLFLDKDSAAKASLS